MAAGWGTREARMRGRIPRSIRARERGAAEGGRRKQERGMEGYQLYSLGSLSGLIWAGGCSLLYMQHL